MAPESVMFFHPSRGHHPGDGGAWLEFDYDLDIFYSYLLSPLPAPNNKLLG
jgi:hypothetical protein